MAKKITLKPGWGKRGYEFLVNAAKIAGVLSLIYGVGFGVFQYFETKKEKRVEQSLALFKQFNNPPFTDYRRSINTAVIGNSALIYEAASDEKKLTEAIDTMVRKGGIATDLILVMDFFDGVVYCAAKNICDADISYDLFYSRAKELYVSFYQYIEAQRNSFAGNDFGAGLETLVKLKKPPVSRVAAAPPP